MTPRANVAEQSIAKHSKSFALASRVLPPSSRGHAVALYAWCRRADDAVDLVPPERQSEALEALRAELNDVYSGAVLEDPVLALFQVTARERGVPRQYADDLLTGMAMDVRGQRYETMDQLLAYCYHVAGCVGLMMCHVMGIRDDRSLARAAHLGIAMQITNICRDVLEDWERDRLYIPDDVLRTCDGGGLSEQLGGPFPPDAVQPISAAIGLLLNEADRYYASGDAGVPDLSWRCSMAIRTARSVYSSIGQRVRRVGCDPTAGRQYVPLGKKLVLMTSSILTSLVVAPWHLLGGRPVSGPERVLSFPNDILPLEQHT